MEHAKELKDEWKKGIIREYEMPGPVYIRINHEPGGPYRLDVFEVIDENKDGIYRVKKIGETLLHFDEGTDLTTKLNKKIIEATKNIILSKIHS